MLDVRRSPELQAAILSLRQAEPSVVREVNAETRRTANPAWQAALAARARRPLDSRIITKGARVAVGKDSLSLKAATSTKALSGGLRPASNWAGAEFGMRTRRATIATHSRKGRPYNVTKMIGRQFANRQKEGRIAFDAASEVGTKVVAGWVHAIVDVFRRDPFEVR